MITATFTDPQGAVQSNAVVCIRSANFSKQTSEYYSLDSSDFLTVTNPLPNVSQNIRFSAYYWINAEAKTAGAAPYILANSGEMDMDFAFQPDGTYEGLTLEEKCEQYLVEVVLPPMQA